MSSSNGLAEAVSRLAESMHDIPDVDLGQPFRWGAHQEGLRFALLGAMHELRALAVELAAERRQTGPPLTHAQHALGQYHAAYRDLSAVLMGVTPAEYERPPAPGEWPLRYIHGHMVGAERNFFALVHHGWQRQREDDPPPLPLPDGEANRLLGDIEDFRRLMDTGSLPEMQAYHARMHDRALSEFAAISDEELAGPSQYWEDDHYSLEYRLHRFDAHLRQHTIQAEKTLAEIGHLPSEAWRLIRLVYAALAEVESAVIGAPEIGLDAMAQLTDKLEARAAEARQALTAAYDLAAAVKSGNLSAMDRLLAAAPVLVDATDEAGIPLARVALYHGQRDAAARLVAAGAELDIHDAAALGRQDIVEGEHVGLGDLILNEFSRDGYTPLQLACFFGHPALAQWLVDHGASVSAVAQNDMAIAPLHAAAAARSTEIVRLLLEAGADPNAAQVGGFRALHTAAQNGDLAMIRLLLDYGAELDPANDDGRTPGALAREAGHTAAADLLESLA